MKKEYDFSKAEQGKFYRPAADLERRFKSEPPTAPLGLASASGGERFGAGSGF